MLKPLMRQASESTHTPGCQQANDNRVTTGPLISILTQADEEARVVEEIVKLEQIVLQESYVSGVHRVGRDVVFMMELLLETGCAKVGQIIFPAIETDEWLSDKGEPTSPERINALAYRYFGSPDEKPDLGTINLIQHENDYWRLSGDWGSCKLRTLSFPKVVLGDAGRPSMARK
jgi:hypothetical protein